MSASVVRNLFTVFLCISIDVFLCVELNVFHEDQYVPVGQPVTIKCHASDTSKPVFWDHRRSVRQNVHNVYDGGLIGDYQQRCTIDSSTYDLTILHVELTDTGEYWCIENYGTLHVTELYVKGIVELL